jgi:carboxylesterase
MVRRVARWHRALGVCTAYVGGRGGERSIHDPEEHARALSYRVATPRLLHELVTLADRSRASLGRVAAPTLLVQSREDNRLAPAVAERAHAALGARERRLVWLEGCGHVLTVDRERERVIALACEWLEARMGAGRRGRRPAVAGRRKDWE